MRMRMDPKAGKGDYPADGRFDLVNEDSGSVYGWELPTDVNLKDVVINNVHSPDHYTVGGIEAIDYIYAKLGPEGFKAYCMGNVLKYVSRWQEKNGIEDLNKAHVYLKWAIVGKPER